LRAALALGVRRVNVIPKPTSRHSPEYKAFLRLLIETREGAGLSQRAVAKRLEKPQSYVSKSETGERRVDVVEVIAFCRAIGISWADFALKVEKVIYSLVPD
jgi:transcriptional regulator with XRE-family HTH domain